MRFLFKTDYEDDIRLFPHSGYLWSYGTLLVLLAIAPYVLSSYLVSQLVFVCIYATVGVALLILTGFTGQASLGHAAFLAIGAYTAAYLQQYNVPFPVYFLAAGLLTGGKFNLGVGTGEALNEHVTGAKWPAAEDGRRCWKRPSRSSPSCSQVSSSLITVRTTRWRLPGCTRCPGCRPARRR